jgi:uncharacterized protein (TIGR02646 family)
MARLIPVKAAPEPASFDAAVRQPGNEWLRDQGIDPASMLPTGVELRPFWRACLDDLHAQYRGICAYLCVYIERQAGGATVDHFVPKSQRASLAYEWSNYRLACSIMNARKGIFDTVLDPFELVEGTFHLEFVTGRIYVNPALAPHDQQRAQETIDRLDLDSPGNRELRIRHFWQYVEYGRPEQFLKDYSPFVWTEAHRQGLL